MLVPMVFVPLKTELSAKALQRLDDIGVETFTEGMTAFSGIAFVLVLIATIFWSFVVGEAVGGTTPPATLFYIGCGVYGTAALMSELNKERL